VSAPISALMPPKARPGEDPADIVDGTRKRKASERSKAAAIVENSAKFFTKPKKTKSRKFML
jgi:hypothetical protein